MTLEESVEYPVAMMRQTSVNETAKMDFGNGIRSIMRQDRTSFWSGKFATAIPRKWRSGPAMTGHQVFTTLHTNFGVGDFPAPARHRHRAGHIGWQHYRHHCAATGAPSVPALQGSLHAVPGRTTVARRDIDAVLKIFRPVGCPAAITGAIGAAPQSWKSCTWTAIWTNWSRAGPHRGSCVEAAMTKNFRSLADEGVHKVVDGTTSLAEVARAHRPYRTGAVRCCA